MTTRDQHQRERALRQLEEAQSAIGQAISALQSATAMSPTPTIHGMPVWVDTVDAAYAAATRMAGYVCRARQS